VDGLSLMFEAAIHTIYNLYQYIHHKEQRI
jgi:hypothetical protein